MTDPTCHHLVRFEWSNERGRICGCCDLCGALVDADKSCMAYVEVNGVLRIADVAIDTRPGIDGYDPELPA